MNRFKLHAPFKPTGDQPEAIKQLVEGILAGEKHQILLGVTGSGKTFTIANVIEQVQKPTLVISHNKTLAAQLYSEFKEFFPENAVEYFVSYYDYYQPEAYIPSKDLYIEKDLSINEQIEKFRLSATSNLLSGRNDVIVVASVSCIYGLGNPYEFANHILTFRVGEKISIDKILENLVNNMYSRNDTDPKFGTFRVKGDTIEIFPSFGNQKYSLIVFGNVIEEIYAYDIITNKNLGRRDSIIIYPASIFMTNAKKLEQIIENIRQDMFKQVAYFLSIGKAEEAKRLEQRVTYDLEMLKELGYCSGIENYSRYFDGRKPGERPYCLIDYFPSDYLMVIDESHQTIPQIRGMYGGDRSRKQILVDYGFRLPSAMDNRPLNFEEFQTVCNQVIYVSATPGDYELEKTGGVFVEQLIRPTGILEPEIIVRPVAYQVDDLINEISNIKGEGRALVTCLTKKSAEELSKFLSDLGIKAKYLHSDVDTVERVEILNELRKGDIDVVVGVNLLREGLDLPEVTLVAILDADKEGFLRNERSLIQTAGRAARNTLSKVILYANEITKSMQALIDETNRRREKQMKYNIEHNITPQNISKTIKQSISEKDFETTEKTEALLPDLMVADPVVEYLTKPQIEKLIKETEKKMKEAAKNLDFIAAAMYRDEILELKKRLKK